ncbi:transmembrane protein 192 [Pogona vitticeps]
MAGVLTPGGRPQQQQLEQDNGSLEITQSMDDDPLLEEALLPFQALNTTSLLQFYRIPTVCVANTLLFLHVAFVVLAFVVGMYCYSESTAETCPGYYTFPLKVQTAIIIAKVILWILYVFLEEYIHFYHHKVRSRGYFHIYRTTRHLKRLPLLIQSTGNAALLLVLSAQHSFPNHNKMYIYLILGILSLELICSMICVVIYTVRVSNFNRAKPRPDVIEEEKKYVYHEPIISEVGFRATSSLEEIVEKQGDVIVFLHHHNALLSKRLLALTSPQSRR